jgi:hypothetical protein
MLKRIEQRELVSLRAQTADHPDGKVGKIGFGTKWFTSENI